MFHYSISFVGFSTTLQQLSYPWISSLPDGAPSSSYLIPQISPAIVPIFTCSLFSHHLSNPALVRFSSETFYQEKGPKSAILIFKTAWQHKTQQGNSSSHTAFISVDINCLHSSITHNSNKLTLPEVLGFFWQFHVYLFSLGIVFRIIEKNSFLYLGVISTFWIKCCYFIVFLSQFLVVFYKKKSSLLF